VVVVAAAASAAAAAAAAVAVAEQSGGSPLREGGLLRSLAVLPRRGEEGLGWEGEFFCAKR
jgi:hypothetical protein